MEIAPRQHLNNNQYLRLLVVFKIPFVNKEKNVKQLTGAIFNQTNFGQKQQNPGGSIVPIYFKSGLGGSQTGTITIGNM